MSKENYDITYTASDTQLTSFDDLKSMLWSDDADDMVREIFGDYTSEYNTLNSQESQCSE